MSSYFRIHPQTIMNLDFKSDFCVERFENYKSEKDGSIEVHTKDEGNKCSNSYQRRC